jgi:4-alpha-glucanotransferase
MAAAREIRLAGRERIQSDDSMNRTRTRQHAPGGAPLPLPTLATRASGLLLHPTSLPGPHGLGDLGPQARRFADFLAAAGQSWWQMLPVGPVNASCSPYQPESTFAGNPLLVSLEDLALEGWLEPGDLDPGELFPAERADHAAARRFREARLAKAFAAFEHRAGAAEREDFDRFRAAAGDWLDDFALFRAIKRAMAARNWTEWPVPLRDRYPGALAESRHRLEREIRYECFVQYLFDRQWRALGAWCAERGIGRIGDLPIFVAHDSAEVWASRELFELDAAGHPTVVAGVPPDYFSLNGQLWGNPLYHWERMAERHYDWWLLRFRAILARFDAVRVDHFIGMARYWEIPAGARTAIEGHWVPAPGAEILERLREAVGEVPIIAEDLGLVTSEVTALRLSFGFPGMRVLQFGFSDDADARYHLPESYDARTVAYTGTHDNNTAVGWFKDEPLETGSHSPILHRLERERALAYLHSDGKEIHWDMIRAVLDSPADTALVPLQDVLGLGSEARMNRPGTATGNWVWRFSPGALTDAPAHRLRALTAAAGRLPASGRGGRREERRAGGAAAVERRAAS